VLIIPSSWGSQLDAEIISTPCRINRVDVEDAMEAAATATVVEDVTNATAAVVVAETVATVAISLARYVAKLGMKPGIAGTATPMMKKKNRRRRRRKEPMPCPMEWTPTGMATPAPLITSPVSSTSSP
jgi:hypothetical protein